MAQCVACSRVISVTRAGLVHVHGPIGNRCPGSQCLPAASASSNSSSTALPSSAPQFPPSSSLSGITDLPPRPAAKILKRVPRASREVAANELATVVGNVVNCNDHGSWVRRHRFPAQCLRVPQRGRRRNLASQVILQVSEESDQPAQPPCKRPLKSNCSDDNLAARVAAKLEEGDVKGAVRLASSEDSIAKRCDATLASLREKHPPPHPQSIIPPCPTSSDASHITLSEEDILRSSMSFPNGSAGWPDGLRPQHLKYLIST